MAEVGAADSNGKGRREEKARSELFVELQEEGRQLRLEREANAKEKEKAKDKERGKGKENGTARRKAQARTRWSATPQRGCAQG